MSEEQGLSEGFRIDFLQHPIGGNHIEAKHEAEGESPYDSQCLQSLHSFTATNDSHTKAYSPQNASPKDKRAFAGIGDTMANLHGQEKRCRVGCCDGKGNQTAYGDKACQGSHGIGLQQHIDGRLGTAALHGFPNLQAIDELGPCSGSTKGGEPNQAEAHRGD